MKKFNFRLQKLLDIRERKEREIQYELSKVMARQNQERQKQEELRSSIAEEQRRFSEKLRKGKFSSHEAIMFEKYVDISLRAIETAQKRIEAMEPEILEIRGRLVEASKQKKVVERLKERKFEEYTYEVNREIAKESDDINQKLFNRNNRGPVS